MDNLIKRVKELNKDLCIRKAKPSDAFGFTNLMQNNYSRKDNIKYFTWRFFACPVPSILYVVVTKENKIVGAYGVNIFKLTNGKLCGLTVDLIIEKAYRQRGLLFLLERKINQFAIKYNCSYLLCLPNITGMKTHTKIEGWQIIQTIPLLVLKSNSRREKQHQNFRVFPEKNQISFEYSDKLLRWRFEENPEYKYLYTKSGKYQSYIKIFSDTTTNTTVGDIVYYNSTVYSKSAFQTLINNSIMKLQNKSAQKIVTWCSEKSPLYPIFLSLDFIPQMQPRYLCIKPLSPDVINPRLLSWQILLGDSEVF